MSTIRDRCAAYRNGPGGDANDFAGALLRVLGPQMTETLWPIVRAEVSGTLGRKSTVMERIRMAIEAVAEGIDTQRGGGR